MALLSILIQSRAKMSIDLLKSLVWCVIHKEHKTEMVSSFRFSK